MYLGRLLMPAAVVLAAVFDASAARVTVSADGFGDVRTIQEALDSAAAGDSILIGPGRYESFQLRESPSPSSPQYSVAHVSIDSLVIVGAGPGLTILGPAAQKSSVNGIATSCISTSGITAIHIQGLSLESTAVAVRIVGAPTLRDLRVSNPAGELGIAVFASNGGLIDSIESDSPVGIVTGDGVQSLAITNSSFTHSLESASFGVVIGNGATGVLVEGCNFRGLGQAIQWSMGGVGVVRSCRILDVGTNAIAVSDGIARVEDSVLGSGGKYTILKNIGSLSVENSVIGGGSMATVLTMGALSIENSHVLPGAGSSVESRAPAGESVEVRRNWWGTPSIESAEAAIVDWNATVSLIPIAAAPVLELK